MSAKTLQRICLRKCTARTKMKQLSGAILVLMAIQLQQANAQDLVLQDTTITTTTTFSANSITAGPNFTVASTGDAILSAATIAIIPQFFVVQGGKLQVVSGAPPVSVETEDPLIPDEFIVRQNYPNPFNPATQISYALPKAQKVEVVVYNVFGQEVRTLISEYQGPGNHSLVWDGTDNGGERASSGVYYYRVTAGKYKVTKKMILMK